MWLVGQESTTSPISALLIRAAPGGPTARTGRGRAEPRPGYGRGSAGSPRGERGGQGGVGIGEHLGGDLQPLDAAQRDVLVFDVDEHARVDLVEGAQELGPERGVVAPAE